MHQALGSAGQRGCESYGELQKLISLTQRKFTISSRSCKLRGLNVNWTRSIESTSLRVRSSTKGNRSSTSTPSPSLTERLHEGLTAVSSTSKRAGDGALEVTPADDESVSAGLHVSDRLHDSERQKNGSFAASERPNGGASLCTPSISEDELPLAFGAPIREGEGVSGVVDDVVNGPVMAPGPWSKLPHRYKLVLSTSLAFVICNMDKVNLSVAIIPMSNQLHWNASTAGLVQSSFFWGYTLSQLPGGWLARFFTGEAVLAVGVLVWSVATAAVPLAASFIPSLLFSRLIVGLGEGVSPSAATDLIARNVPATERSRAVAFVFNGLNVGSVIGLILAPVIIEHFGWEFVFYMFGVLGIIWCIGFTLSTGWSNPWEAWDTGKSEVIGPNHSETKALRKVRKQHNGSTPVTSREKIPWKAFFKSSAVWAMIYTHFCGNWGHYSILAWLPTYFSEELHLSLTNAALVSVVPPLGGMFVSSFAAPMADHLISKGVNATFVRKFCQTIAFLSPTAGMTLCSLDLGLSAWVTVSIVASSLALSSFALGGLYCTHQDISPKYASILLGITNTAGAIPGILGVYLTGVFLDRTHSWTMALFAPCIFFWITGTVVWNLFASSEPQSFEE